MDGIWDSAAANAKMVTLLADKAKAYRQDPEVQAAFEEAGIFDLAKPTLGEGESISDLLADTSSYEEFDAEKAAERNYGFVKLNQLAVNHLIG
ncbi:hypothetical protein ACFP47_00760 [Nesterenkonia lacusekhoensis]|uniref:Xylose isomerase n=1 Tax=Nesterenkonia lacusekhoensis TaxID=150832 RepID=A0ABS4T5H8_9MICC|nr:hypothetical protein [Nesterenkonia lacusekhoensis]MBP2319239.1 hypothetical protein [Nesterenkonia lacusekhoensis]